VSYPEWEYKESPYFRAYLEDRVSKGVVDFILEHLKDREESAYAAGHFDGALKQLVGRFQPEIDEIRAELGTALGQAIPSDDHIIIGHVKNAYVLAGGAS